MAVATSDPKGSLAVALGHARTLLVRSPRLAEEQAREILGAVPGQPEALTLHGLALAALGRSREAIAALVAATTRDPESPDAWRALGDQMILVGDGTGADYAYAQQIRSSVRDPVLRAAAVALCEGNLPVAEPLLKGHLKQHPTDVAAIRMLAELAGRIGRYADAENLLRRAVELAPGFAPARFNLATVLYRQNRNTEALVELDRLMAADPDNFATRNLAAAALGRVGDVAEAVVHFEHVLARQPDAAKIWLSYGHALKTLGRQGDSVAAYRRCIGLEPGFGEAWWSLANLKTVRLESADIAAMTTALAAPGLTDEDRFHLHFALGKAHEDADDVAAAFGHYAEGNRLRLAALDYDPTATSDRVDRSIALLQPAFLAARAGQGCPAPDPIFVLGMPRSGSTLVEQILASHPLVEGTQELPDIQMFAGRLGGQDEDAYPSVMKELGAARLQALGEEYLERTRVHRKTGRPYFIDKMPNNWAHVGLIHLILPNARIIDTRRHPLGCGFSNFKQHFARGQSFSYSLETMGRYYADYVRMMDHVDAVLPGRIHRVHYEAMIEHTEAEVRRLLAALGLPFDPACLRFHESGRAVRTASSEQVRRPIYREGLDQWQRFGPYLGPLRSALGTVLDDYTTRFDPPEAVQPAYS
ncbi:sulfotransferase [Sphingosinicellaceae bacterium]|nr:sulfotransferase [Sphingosinicellaceae bacterium]